MVELLPSIFLLENKPPLVYINNSIYMLFVLTLVRNYGTRQDNRSKVFGC